MEKGWKGKQALRGETHKVYLQPLTQFVFISQCSCFDNRLYLPSCALAYLESFMALLGETFSANLTHKQAMCDTDSLEVSGD